MQGMAQARQRVEQTGPHGALSAGPRAVRHPFRLLPFVRFYHLLDLCLDRFQVE